VKYSIHSQVVIDNTGEIRHIECGFLGHQNDAQQFRLMRQIGQDLPFPQNCVLLRDKIDRKGMSLSPRDTATHDYEVKVCVPPSCYGEKAWTSHQAYMDNEEKRFLLVALPVLLSPPPDITEFLQNLMGIIFVISKPPPDCHQ
jgi:hypothetical protein